MEVKMSKLGYTWYPKDWSTNESVFQLSLQERGLFRELIDLAMLNDNKVICNYSVWCRKFDIKHIDLTVLLDRLTNLNLIERKTINNEVCLFIPSCEKRLNLVRGGAKGGKKSKPNPKPIDKPNPKPISNQIEKEKEKEIKKENNIIIRKSNFRQSIKDYNNQFPGKYPKQLYLDFESYWTEPNQSNTKMKFELEKTFSLSNRLATWFRNDFNKNYQEKKVNQPKAGDPTTW